VLVGSGPWWQQATSLAGVAAQQDLLDDDTAGRLLHTLLDLVARGRNGELVDSPFHNLTERATKTVCVLAGRGTSVDALALLEQFANDIPRDENHYRPHDNEHVDACQAIAVHHPRLTWQALNRIFDLAEVGADRALNTLHGEFILKLIREPSTGPHSMPAGTLDAERPSLTPQQRDLLRSRLKTMAASGRYQAGLALVELGVDETSVITRAVEARDRLLNRADPDGRSFSVGTQMVPDSCQIAVLDPADQQACLDKMLTIAEDRREAAQNRQDALTAAGNLVLGLGDGIKARVHLRSRGIRRGQPGRQLPRRRGDRSPPAKRLEYQPWSSIAACSRTALSPL
jgi:hypothetical protein